MILGGLWFGSVKPAMSTFLKPFVEVLKLLKNGNECFSPAMCNFICKGYLLPATPARLLFVTLSNTMVHLVVGNAFRGEKVQKGERDIPIYFHIMQKTLKDHKEQVNVFFQMLSP